MFYAFTISKFLCVCLNYFEQHLKLRIASTSCVCASRWTSCFGNMLLHFICQISLFNIQLKLIFELYVKNWFEKYVLWYSCECMSKSDKEEKELMKKVVIFVFFAHKMYSRSFIKLRLNHWCHMDYFNDVLTTFLGIERGSWAAIYAG